MKLFFLIQSFYITLFCNAQINSVKPLKIGDIIPDIEFKLMNSDTQVIKLSDYKGKLVVLDFWATWCGACRLALHKSDSLKKVFGEKIVILAVNSSNREQPDDESKISHFYQKLIERYPDFKVPIVVNDTLAFLLFPNTAIPECVIVTPNGKVGAITFYKYITTENIEKFLKGENPSLPIKDDSLRNANRK